jgi:hypothetical protein
MSLSFASVLAPVRTPYQGWAPCIEWCEHNCQGLWWYEGEGIFQFADKQDYTMFLLVWA